MKVGDLYAELSLKDATFKSQLKQVQAFANQITKNMSKDMQGSLKNAFKGLAPAANTASKQAAAQIKTNLQNSTKGLDFGKALNFKMDLGPLNSVTTAFSGMGLAGGTALGLIAAGLNKVKDGLGAVVSEGMSFSAQMSTVASVAVTTLTEISGGTIQYSAEARAAMKALEDQALSLGETTKFTATEVGSAQELLARAGFSVNETIAATPGLLAAAAAEGLDLATTADIASSALRGFGLEADQMNMVADLLAATSATSNASIRSLGESFKYIAPVAQAVQLNITDVNAALGLLANMGIKGSVAGRNLASGLMSLAKPSAMAKKLMEELNITLEDAEGNFLPLPAVMEQVSKATEGMSDAEALRNIAILVGKDNAKTFLGLLNSQYKTMEDGKEVTLSGAEAMQVYSDALAGMEGAAEKMAKIRMDNLSGDLELLKSAASGLAIRLFKEVEPALRAFVQGATQAIITLGPTFIQVFGTIRSVISQMISNVMPGLIQAWQNLQPAIAAIGPIVMKALGFLAAVAVEASKWGGQIVAQLAAGMSAAIQRVVAVLKYIGSIIAYWLRPNSPPKIVPELDQYGEDAGQLYVDSFGNADVSGAMQALGDKVSSAFDGLAKDAEPQINSAGISLTQAFMQGMSGWDKSSFTVFDDLTGSIEESIRSLGESGGMAKDTIVPAILESRNAVMQFVNSLRETGTASEESINQLLESLGPVSGEIEGLVRSYADLAEANLNLALAQEEVARAQEEVNRITEEYDRIISPLQGKLDSINAEQQRIKDLQRVEELQKKIAEGKLDEHELALAQLEIEEIGVKQQIDATEEERDVALEAAEEKLKAAEDAQKLAEENQKAVQAQYDAAQNQISVNKENNDLMREQVKILSDMAEAQRDMAEAAASGGGIGGGAGLGGIGGGGLDMPEMPEFNPEELFPPELFSGFEEVETAISEVTGAFSDFNAGFEEAKGVLTGFFGEIPGTISPAREAIDGFFSTPLGTELQQGAGVVAGYFKNDFPRELGEGVGVAQSWLQKIDKSEFGQSLQRGAQVVGNYFLNDWPKDFQNGVAIVSPLFAPLATEISRQLDLAKMNASVVGSYFLNDWPTDLREGFQAVSDFFSTFKSNLEQFGRDYFNPAKSIGDNIIAGIIAGLDAASGGLFSSISGIIKQALGSAQSAAKIQSPSKLFEMEVGIPLVLGIAAGVRQGSPYVITQVQAVFTKILTETIKLRDGVINVLAELGPLLKEQAEAMMNDLDSLEIIEGMLPDDDGVIAAKEAFDDIVRELEDNKQRLLDIDKELAEDRKKINEEIVKEQKESGEKLAKLRQEQADLDKEIADVRAGIFKDKRDQDDMKAIDKERARIQGLIRELQAGPQTDINKQRLAELQARDAELAGKRQEIIDENLSDLLEDRGDVAKDIAEIEIETAERLAELRQELADAETEADAERAEAIREQIRLTEELQKARQEFGNQQNLFAQLQQIAELTQQALEQAKQAVNPLAELDPARANRFFNQYQESIDAIYDLEQKLKEEAFGDNDPRKIKLLQDQLALLKDASKAEFEALKQAEREKINEEIAKGGDLTKKLADLQKRLGEEEDPDRRKDLEAEIAAQQEEIRLFNLRLPLLREQLALIDQLRAYELNTSNLPTPGTRLADQLPSIEEILRMYGFEVPDIPIKNTGGPLVGIGGPTPNNSTTNVSNYNLVGNYNLRPSGMSLMDEIRMLQRLRRT